jgi:hypothetical protein
MSPTVSKMVVIFVVSTTVLAGTLWMAGGGLDEMTSADDLHLISWRNVLGLSAVVIGVLIPVGLRYFFQRDVVGAIDVEQAESGGENQDPIITAGPRITNKGKTAQLVLLSDDEASNDFLDDDADSDVILEAGAGA